MQWKLFFHRKRLASLHRKRLASLLTRRSGASPTHRQISEICLNPASSRLLLPIPAKHPLTICMLRLRWKTAAFSHPSFAESLSIFSSNRFPACTCQICICPAHCTGQGTHPPITHPPNEDMHSYDCPVFSSPRLSCLLLLRHLHSHFLHLHFLLHLQHLPVWMSG